MKVLRAFASLFSLSKRNFYVNGVKMRYTRKGSKYLISRSLDRTLTSKLVAELEDLHGDTQMSDQPSKSKHLR